MGKRHVARLIGMDGRGALLRCRAAIAAAVLVGVGAIGGVGAFAQQISEQTATSVTLSQPQKEEVAAFAREQLKGLGSDSPEAQQRARKALLEPLDVPGVSVSFRIEYSQRLLDELQRLAKSESEPTAINAVRVMGELGTATSLEALAAALGDERAGVRRAATLGYERTFRAAGLSGSAGGGGGTPAITAAQANQAIDALGARLSADDEPLVLDGVVLALDSAIHMPSVQQLEGVRERAVTTLSRALAERLKATPPDETTLDAATARALESLVRAQTDLQRKMSAATHKSIALLAGHVLARARVQIQQGLVADREMTEAVVRLAERAYVFAHRQMGNQPLELRLGDLVHDQQDDQYVKKVIELIGPNGMLTGAPFGFADNEFVGG